MSIDITEIFCVMDDFCKEFEPMLEQKRLNNKKSRKRRRKRKGFMSLSEIMTILMMFHLSKMKTFKDFYFNIVQIHFKPYFPKLLSYNRFLEWIPRTTLAFATLFNMSCGRCMGISFIDSMPLKVCHNKRISRHKVFKGLAGRGKSSMGWFFGLKLHAVINPFGELIDIMISSGNTPDNKGLKSLSKNLGGLLFGDKGYISKEQREWLLEHQEVKLFTTIRKNMKPIQMTPTEKALLKKRFLIETVFGKLQAETEIDHTRHRSPRNFLVNLFSALVCYNLYLKKPVIQKLEIEKDFLAAA